jgi:hypothetical protein
MANLDTDHYRIAAAGWSYRTNDRGWIIYRDPQTGRWHIRSEAVAIVAASTLTAAAVSSMNAAA